MRREDVGGVVLMVVFGMFICFMVYALTVSGSTKAACLRAGYPSAQVDYRFNRYCIKRVDQTDVVVPFEQVVQ